MSDTSQGTGGLTFDKTKPSWPSELNVLLSLIIIIVIFEALGQILPYMKDQSFLFDSRGRFDSIFNEARLKIIILQVAIIGIIALGVSQVIITAGIDLSSGPLVAATAMIAMSFGQTVIFIKKITPINPRGKARIIINGCLKDLNKGVIIKNAKAIANKRPKLNPLKDCCIITTSPSKLTS